MARKNRNFYTKSISLGLAISIVLLFGLSFFNDIISGQIFLHDALPHYGQILAMTEEDFASFAQEDAYDVSHYVMDMPQIVADTIPHVAEASPIAVIGLNDVEFEQSTTYEDVQAAIDTFNPHVLTPYNIEELRNPDILRNSMYIVDPRTIFVPSMFNVDAMLATDFRVNPQSIANGDPVILIFHTHSTEMFADSNPNDLFTGIFGVGAYLADLLNAQGLHTIHYTRRFDIVNGQSAILGAYERQEPYIRRILEENPTIEIVIDIHRDGLPESAPRLVTTIDGRPTARLMFVNGLSTRNVNGVATPIPGLPNPHLDTNLAFSFQMQLLLNQYHPNLNRRIYLNAFRYSLHFAPKSLFVEVGDQRSTFEEATNAMYPLVDALLEMLR